MPANAEGDRPYRMVRMSGRKFVGIVLDGPWKGRTAANLFSSFKVCIVPDIGSVLDGPPVRANEIVRYEEVHYRWKPTAEAWEMVR